MASLSFRVLPEAACARHQGRLVFTILGVVASGTPLHSVALNHEHCLISRLQYRPLIRNPHNEVMHSLGQLPHVFALTVSQTDTIAGWTGIFEIEATDWLGEVRRGRIECMIDHAAQDAVKISGSGEPITELPSDPPIVAQLVSLEIADSTLTARGWAVARDGVRTVRIAAGDHVRLALRDQEPGSDVPEYCRDYPDADRAGFAAQIELAAQDAPQQIWLMAQSSDGTECYAAFPVPPSAIPAALVSNLTMPFAPGASNRPPAIIFVEYPRIEEGAVALNGRQECQLRGWAVAQQGIDQLNVYVNGRYIASADYGAVRKDVAAVFPRWRGALKSGFSLRLPARVFLNDPSTIELEAQLAPGKTISGHFVLSFGTRLARPADDSPWGLLMTDISIWQHARTAKMWAAGREEQQLRELEVGYEASNDAAGVTRVRLIRQALEILGIAWSGEPIDPTLRGYLSKHGYL